MEHALISNNSSEDDKELTDMVALLDAQPSMTKECVQVNPLPVQNLETEENMPSIIQPLELEL